MCHCRNSCKARRVKQVEQQERKCCYCCREPCFDRCTNNHGILCIITSYVCKNTHCTYDGLFCGESGDGGCNRLPFTKSKRGKDRSKDTTKDSHDTVVAVLNKSDSASCISDAGKDPHDNCCKEKNGTGFDDEAFQSLPNVKQNCLYRRNMILWKLHYKRSRFTGERFGFLQNDSRYKNCYNTDKVHQWCDETSSYVVTGCISCHDATHKSDNRKLGTTWDKCRCHNCQTTVIICLDRFGSHDSRDSTAGGDKKRDKALSGKSKMTEYTVHDECNTNHITAVFKDGKEQEQNRHLRNKSKHCPKTTDDTVRYKAYQPVSNTSIAESIRYNTLDGSHKAVVCPVCYHGTNCCYRYIINDEHGKDKDRKAENTVRYNTVDLIGNCHLISASLNVCRNNLLDILISSIRYDTLCIIILCLLKLRSDLLDPGLCRNRKVQSFFHLAVSLKKLYCIPSSVLFRDICRNKSLDLVYSLLNCFRKFHLLRWYSVLVCTFDCLINNLFKACSLKSRCLNDRASKCGA